MFTCFVKAKLAEKKHPKRDFLSLAKSLQTQQSGESRPSVMIDLSRHTLHAGRISEEVKIGDMVRVVTSVLAETDVTVSSVGCHVDSSTFKGQFEDLLEVRANSQAPVLCDDFVMFAYQLFRVSCVSVIIRPFTLVLHLIVYVKINYDVCI